MLEMGSFSQHWTAACPVTHCRSTTRYTRGARVCVECSMDRFSTEVSGVSVTCLHLQAWQTAHCSPVYLCSLTLWTCRGHQLPCRMAGKCCYWSGTSASQTALWVSCCSQGGTCSSSDWVWQPAATALTPRRQVMCTTLLLLFCTVPQACSSSSIWCTHNKTWPLQRCAGTSVQPVLQLRAGEWIGACLALDISSCSARVCASCLPAQCSPC